MIRPIILSTLLFILFSGACRAAGDIGKGVITGAWITNDHGPMTGAQVLLFNAAKGPAPSSSRFLRLPDAGTLIDNEGRFSAELPEGEYYLVMRKKLNPAGAGPPEDGDPQYYGRSPGGEPKLYPIRAGRTVDIGTITAAEPFKREKVVTRAGMTGIEGTVIDQQGKPVPGLRVMAYETDEMKGMPRWASDTTGDDGRYFLSLSRAGAYFLQARTHYGGGKPAEGELTGKYRQSGKIVAVTVEKGGIVRKIDIQVIKFSSKRE